MPQYSIPDITDTEPRVERRTPKERYGRDVEVQPGGAAVRIRPAGREPTSRPVIVRQPDDGRTFIVFDTGERACRCRYFGEPREQTGTGIPALDDLTGSAVTLRQAQDDLAAKARGGLPGR